MSSPEQVVREMYAAFGRKDELALRELLDPRIEWIQCAGFPGGGVRHGIEAVLRDVFGALRSDWSEWKLEIDEYLEAASTVIVLGSYLGRHARTERTMQAVFAHVYEVESGRITRFRQFTDTQVIAQAAREATES